MKKIGLNFETFSLLELERELGLGSHMVTTLWYEGTGLKFKPTKVWRLSTNNPEDYITENFVSELITFVKDCKKLFRNPNSTVWNDYLKKFSTHTQDKDYSWGKNSVDFVNFCNQLRLENIKKDLLEEKQQNKKDLVLREAQQGNIVVVSAPEVMTKTSVENFIKQSADGILYDLNRSEAVVLTFIDDPKWVNDYAVAMTIRALKSKVEELEAKVEELSK